MLFDQIFWTKNVLIVLIELIRNSFENKIYQFCVDGDFFNGLLRYFCLQFRCFVGTLVVHIFPMLSSRL